MGCVSNQIPDIPIYKEIPFVDAPEGVMVKTVSPIEGTINAEEWKKIAPYLLCVDPDGWAQIKLGWLKACRLSGKDCNVMVDSVDTLVKQLDDIARQVQGGK